GGGEGFGRACNLRGARGRGVVERDDARAAEHRADAYSSDEARSGEGRNPHTKLAQYRALGIGRLAFRDLQHKTSHLQILWSKTCHASTRADRHSLRPWPRAAGLCVERGETEKHRGEPEYNLCRHPPPSALCGGKITVGHFRIYSIMRKSLPLI